MHLERDCQYIDLEDINHFRTELMGMAMIFIILFHIKSSCWYALYGLCKSGDVGVDIFLLLSGVGLWYSWTNNSNFISFYKRRFRRIFPTWFFFSSIFYVSHFLCPRFKGDNYFAWVDLMGDITINWDFWRTGDNTFWFIPTLMFLYLIAPLYMYLIERIPCFKWLPVIFIIWGITIYIVEVLTNSLGHLVLLWGRIPIFLLGINFGRNVKDGFFIRWSSKFNIMVVFILSLLLSWILKYDFFRGYPKVLENYIYIPLSLCAVLLLVSFFRLIPAKFLAPLSFIGILSLEFYLIHQNFILCYFPEEWNYCFSFVLCLFITAPLAWLVNKCIQKVSAILF